MFTTCNRVFEKNNSLILIFFVAHVGNTTESQNVFLSNAKLKFLTLEMYCTHTANSVRILNVNKK